MSRGPKGLHLITCTECNGAGEHKGIWQLMVCTGCNGLGEVRSDNEQPLEDHQIINRLRERNRQLIRRVQDMTSINNKPEPTTEELQRKHRGVLG